jgi:hypothetical protein
MSSLYLSQRYLKASTVIPSKSPMNDLIHLIHEYIASLCDQALHSIISLGERDVGLVRM